MKKYLALTAILMLISSCHKVEKIEEKPNVILIMADDLGYSDIGAFGGEIDTPNLNDLAENGLRFSNVYNTSKCFPSRACMLTGLYAQRTGYNETFRKPFNNAITIGNLFKIANYDTYWSGKHHSVINPIEQGFDKYSGLLDGASNHFNPGEQREGEDKPAQKNRIRSWVIDGTLYKPYTPKSKDFYSTDAFTDYALDWLNSRENKKKPFLLYLAYTAPHDPLMAWPEDIKKYKNLYKKGYEAIRKDRFKKQKKIGLVNQNNKLPASEYVPFDELTEDEKNEEILKMAVYAAMIDRIDQNIGKLLRTLKNQGIEKNTIILFVSDNGSSSEVVNLEDSGEIGTLTKWTSLGKNWANVSNTPYKKYKNWSYEGGIKTPMIAYWPNGIKSKNNIVETPIHFIDFMATFADLLKVKYPQKFDNVELFPLDGISFLPSLKGESNTRQQPLFWQWHKGKAVRKDNWKLVQHDSIWELYNLDTDPFETTNIIEQHNGKAKELINLYNNWEQDVENPNTF